MRRLLAFPQRIGWRDHLVGLLLAVAWIGVLLATSGSLGFSRDEGFYFHAASEYAKWFQALLDDPSKAMTRPVIDRLWGYNHEHPSLVKSLFALSWMFLYEKWKVFDQASDAFRFPGMALAGLSLWLTYLFGARVHGRAAGLAAAVLFALMPRVFYHAHLACFDIPIVAMWMLSLYVYWRAVTDGGVVRILLAGLAFGLALETKHNAWILPGVVGPHALVMLWAHYKTHGAKGLVRVPATLFSMAVAGPLVFWALWPWMWNDTVPRLKEYFNFHFNHVYYNMEFLGANYFDAPSPRGYMPGMILATVPSITLLLMAIGLIPYGREFLIRLRTRSLVAWVSTPRVSPVLLSVLAAAAALSPWLFTKTPIFGGTKHWMTAYPFLCLFAGVGLVAISNRVGELTVLWAPRKAWVAQMLLVVACLIAPLLLTIHSHPFGLTSYVPLVGGTRGAASLGLNRQFWGFTTQTVCERYVNVQAPKGASVFIHDTAWDSWGRMIDEKRARPDLRGVGGSSQSQIALVHHELHMNEVDHQIWVAFGTRAPSFVLTHDGVPVVSVYERLLARPK